MENIERTHFVVLTGHLDDRPLPDLVRTLRAQRKSGRLQVEYPDAPGSFFFEDGQLVDAQLGALRGLEALYAALDLRGASFNFNPLVKPPERNIDRQQQQFISDLIEAPRREALPEIEAESRGRGGPTIVPLPPRHEPLQLGPAASELIAPLEVRLVAVEAAITSASRRFSRERLLYMGVIGFLCGLIIATIIQVFYPARPAAAPASSTAGMSSAGQVSQPVAAEAAARGEVATARGEAAMTRGEVATAASSAVPANDARPDAAPGESARGANAQTVGAARKADGSAGQLRAGRPSPAARNAPKAEGNAAARGAHVVQVLMEVKNGQVTAARVLNPRPGAGDYESLALRMAKQRRYPENFTGAERLQLRVKP